MNEFEALSMFQVAEVELVYRSKIKPADRLKVASSAMAYEVFMSVWDMNKIELLEQAKMIMLDPMYKCLGVVDIGSGGITNCLVDPRIVFSTALKARANSIILAHNHPSGNTKPSKADIQLTAKLHEGGALLDIRVNDHLVVTPREYFSLQDNGLMP